jgi:hypothetical protein
MQVRETLHANAVEQKKRQMRKLEAQLAAKRNENATLALHLAGEQRHADCDILWDRQTVIQHASCGSNTVRTVHLGRAAMALSFLVQHNPMGQLQLLSLQVPAPVIGEFPAGYRAWK